MNELKYILYFFLVVFLGIQFFSPDKNIGEINPIGSFENEIETPKEINDLLGRACYDCHSNNTNYPWYGNIAPVSWYVSSHVEGGKKTLNFSEWNKYTQQEKQEKIDKSADLIKRRWMPMREYLGQHHEALMTNEEVEKFANWFSNIKLELEVKQCIDNP